MSAWKLAGAIAAIWSITTPAWAGGVYKQIESPDGTARKVLILVPEAKISAALREEGQRTDMLDSAGDARRFRDQLCALSRRFINVPPQIAEQMRNTAAKQCRDASAALSDRK